eukprot:12889613-Alexandrium_andersonii.AAC.1
MSASLCGLGDVYKRQRQLQPARNWCEGSWLPEPAAPAGARILGWPDAPVSYTHLTLPTICSV